jgi:hypothetical protein
MSAGQLESHVRSAGVLHPDILRAEAGDDHRAERHDGGDQEHDQRDPPGLPDGALDHDDPDDGRDEADPRVHGGLPDALHAQQHELNHGHRRAEQDHERRRRCCSLQTKFFFEKDVTLKT